jgi:hypothetical protein
MLFIVLFNSSHNADTRLRARLWMHVRAAARACMVWPSPSAHPGLLLQLPDQLLLGFQRRLHRAGLVLQSLDCVALSGQLALQGVLRDGAEVGLGGRALGQGAGWGCACNHGYVLLVCMICV